MLSRVTSTRGTALGFIGVGVGVLLIVGGLVAYDRVWVARNQMATNPSAPVDPGVRVGGAIRSISGTDSVRRVSYDAATRSAKVDVTSKYYEAAKPRKENQEYLATEGRLGAQLALYQNTEVDSVTVLLYAGRDLLATVTAKQGQAFAQMNVVYSG
ncbi:MAG: hypothetical protein ACREER_04415, partial [Alphaproteobacteria bacterium]